MTHQTRGRPRSRRVHEAILAAARDLVQRDGYEGTSMDGVAKKAGVGKQTLYRWWPSKASLVAEAVLDAYDSTALTGPPTSDDIAVDLDVLVRTLLRSVESDEQVTQMRALVAAAAVHDAAAERLWNRFTAPARQVLADRVSRGQADGQVRTSIDPTAVADMVIGTVVYTVLTRRGTDLTISTDSDWGRTVVDLILSGILVKPGVDRQLG